MRISDLDAYQVFDSRGMPTVEARLELEDGRHLLATVPSGASTGRYEALELRDGDPSRFAGYSVNKAVNHIVDLIRPLLVGEKVTEQEKLDRMMIELDGTPNKSKLGANAILAVSMALARGAALAQNLPLYASLGSREGTLLPLPEIQIIGGGAHSAGRIDIQDFMIICTGASDYSRALEMTFGVYRQCGLLLQERGKLAGVADEGGYWPQFSANEEAMDLLVESIRKAGYRPGRDIHLSLDLAAAEYYKDGKYHLRLEDRSLSPDRYYELVEDWCTRYPVISIEDPFAESDTENWKRLTRSFGDRLQIIGDDLFTTNTERVEQGMQEGWANSVLIKLNQIGSVTETLECIRKTQAFGWTPVISARSGETEDAFISHLAVATNAGQLKVGSFSRSERMVKWNEILRIERSLGGRANYIGGDIFPFETEY